MSLAVFDISKVVENGIEITPEVDQSSGTIRYVTYLIMSGADLIHTLLAIPNPSSVPSSLALQKPSRSLNRMPITKRAKMKYSATCCEWRF